MIVAITGGTGFIGRNLVLRHLRDGDTVRVLTRRDTHEEAFPNNVYIFHGDLTDSAQTLHSFVDGADLLYHCAAEISRPQLMYDVHIRGTQNLLAAASGKKIGRWIQLSSVGVYGSQVSGVITENTALHPVGIYETTKVESDKLVINAAKRGEITFSMLRPSNVFGQTMTNRSLFQLITTIDKGLYFFIGKPGASANYIHVDNVIEGLIRCGRLNAAKGQIYNISDYATIEDFVAIIADELARPVPRLRLPERPVRFVAAACGRLPGFPLTESRVVALTGRAIYSTEKIEHELGYTHQISMEDGLRQMVQKWKKAL